MLNPDVDPSVRIREFRDEQKAIEEQKACEIAVARRGALYIATQLSVSFPGVKEFNIYDPKGYIREARYKFTSSKLGAYSLFCDGVYEPPVRRDTPLIRQHLWSFDHAMPLPLLDNYENDSGTTVSKTNSWSVLMSELERFCTNIEFDFGSIPADPSNLLQVNV